MAAERWARWGAALLPVAVLALYAPVAAFEFLEMDDGSYLTQNPHLAGGLSWRTLGWAFTSTYFGWWHPLTWLSHLADVSLFGSWAGGHHLTSAVLHAANAGLMVAALRSLGVGPGRALAAAALIALHPTRVESVAWLSERKDLVFAFFGLLALIAWARYRARPSAGRYAALLAAYAASLMGKTMLVTFPFLLVLIEAWLPAARPVPWRRRALEVLPLIALALLAGLSTVYAQGALGAIQPMSVLPLSDRLAGVPLAYVHYLATTFWPADLAAYYERWSPTAAQWGGALALCVLVAGALLALRRRVPHLAFGAAWFALALLPVSGVAQAGGALTADRYLYWPHLGLFTGLVLSVPEALALRPLVRLSAALAAAGLAVLSAFQLTIWRDSETLYRATLEARPDTVFMKTSLGLWLLKQGRYADAVPWLEQSAPRDPHAQSILGIALLESGDPARGRSALEEAVRRWPHDPGVRRNAALGLARLSGFALAAGNLAQARADAERAVALAPGNPQAEAARSAAGAGP